MKVRRGYTIVEVVVAMLISAVMITAIFSVALSSKRSGMMADSKMIASSSSQSVAKLLANYMTANWTQTVVPGPNTRGTNTWSLDGLDYTDVGRAGAWALAPGSHIITGKSNGTDPEGLFPRIRGAYGGTLTYDVQWPSCAQCGASSCTPPLGATCQPNINVTTSWSQP